jgi:regulator of replication initiation timing
MSLYRNIQNIKARIIDTERLLDMVREHPIMSVGLIAKINTLKEELAKFELDTLEPKVQLLFSGGAVSGSLGIKSNFISKTLVPFQEMVKTQFAMLRYGLVGKRGQAKSGVNTELYLTALPTGSFGVELSQLEPSDLFAERDVAKAIQQVIELVAETADSDESFEKAIEKSPNRHLVNLKKFLGEIAEENSVLKMESGNIGIEISKEKVKAAYDRVSTATVEATDMVITGIFRGILLDSIRFEVQDENGFKYSGTVSDDIGEEQLVEYNNFLNARCEIHLQVRKTTFITGKVKTEYELMQIRTSPSNSVG